ncbi:TonB-dependent receptor [uncultured Sphingomonas sp.]|uniref:TonB-dependent receptor n=1 Tax=uncultured Sphingomonas sp. TaxID=158754 RepID=UPI0035C9DD6A
MTGTYAKSLAAATEAKRTAGYGVDSIASTDIAKFPAQNVAEALQLVSGVAITRPRGEGLYVSVRGLGPQFQSTLLNGRTIAINELIENGGANGRQFRFEVLPAEFVSRIDVVKTPTADMTEGALGGNIDVQTFRPLEIDARTTLNVRGTYTDHTGKVEPNATILTSAKSNDGTFGILAGAQYWGKQVRNDRFFNFGWVRNRLAAPLGADIYAPTRTRPTIETEHRERISGIVSAQWRPTPELETTLDVLATRLDVAYDEFGLDIFPDDTSVPGRIPMLVPGSTQVDGDTLVRATVNNVRFMATRERSLNRHDLLTIGLRQLWSPGRWRVSANINWSDAHSYHPSFKDATVRSRVAFFAPFTYDATGGYKMLPTLGTPVDPANPASYVGFPFDVAYKDSKDRDVFSRLDVAYEFDGVLTKLAVGGEYHWRERDYDRRDFVLNDLVNVPLPTIGQSFYEPLPYDNFLKNVPGVIPRNWVAPVTQAFFDRLFSPTIAARPLGNADLLSSFVVEEKIAAAYVRADYAFPLGAIDVTGNLGIRYVHTDQVSSGTLVNGTTPTPANFPQKFNNVLPSFNLRAELTPTLLGRLAASRVLTRPNVTDTAPRIVVARDSPVASGGNPALKPFLATQFDGSLEWYFNRRGALTGAIFYKTLDDYITAENVDIEVPGRGTILLNTQINGGSAKLYGAEVAYNQVFTFLPAPFDGLGVQASYTRTEVRAEYTVGARTIRNRLIGLSKQSYNVVGFYEKGPVSTRLSYVWRDRYLTSNGSTTQAPIYAAPFGSLDGNLSFQATSNVTLSVEAINIARAKAYSYNDDVLRFGEINYYGRTVLFGARAEF